VIATGSQKRSVDTAGSSNPSIVNNGGTTQIKFPQLR